MEVFGVKRVGCYSLPAFLAKMFGIQTAARIHRVSLDEFLSILEKSVYSNKNS